MKKFTTLAGSLILVWFIFSPIIGLMLFSHLLDTSMVSFCIYFILTYLILGILFYLIIDRNGGFYTKIGDEKPESEWSTAVNYTIVTNILAAIPLRFITPFFNNNDLFALYIIINPLIIWFAAQLNSNWTKNRKNVPEGVAMKSIYLFTTANVLIYGIIRIMSGQYYFMVNDIVIVLDILAFVYATKKYLPTNTQIINKIDN